MPSPENPSPKRKGRAAIVIVAIVLVMIVVLFVGTNLQRSQEVEEGPPEGVIQTN